MAEIAKKKRTLDEFFQDPLGLKAPQEYVTISSPEREAVVIKQLEEEEKKNKAGDKNTKVSRGAKGQPVVDSGALDVMGVTPAKPKPPVAPAPVVQAPAPVSTPVPAPQPAVEPAPTPVTEAPKKQPIDGPGFPWDRLLVGATPLLTGLLTGNPLEGVNESAKYFTETEKDLSKRQLDLDSKLAELKAKRELAGSGGEKRFTAQNVVVELPGQLPMNVKASHDTYTGQYFYPDNTPIPGKYIRSGYAVNPEEFDRRLDNTFDHKLRHADAVGQGAYDSPTTKLRSVVRNGKEITIEGQDVGTLNPKQQADREKLTAQFKQNPIIAKVTPVAIQAKQLVDLLSSGNPVAQKAARTALARMSLEVGNLNQMEQEVYNGSPSVMAQIKRFMNLQVTDEPLTPPEIEGLLQVARFYTDASKDLIRRAVKETHDVGTRDYNLPEDTVNRTTSPIAGPLLDQITKGEVKAQPVAVVHGGRTWTSPKREMSVPFLLNGVVNFAEPKDWAEIKKQYPKAQRLK